MGRKKKLVMELPLQPEWSGILFNKSPGKIITTRVDLNGHRLVLVLNIEEVFFILLNIYRYCSMSHNQRLFSELLDVIVELIIVYPN